jgi:hypothetical protein
LRLVADDAAREYACFEAVNVALALLFADGTTRCNSTWMNGFAGKLPHPRFSVLIVNHIRIQVQLQLVAPDRHITN